MENRNQMERVNRIIKNPLFQKYMELNEAAEAQRKFCHHDMVHFLNVARIGMILNLQEQAEIPQELLYAAALLHDIGRYQQYADGTPHELASAERAPQILAECGFDESETGVIIEAIRNHRSSGVKEEHNLNGILYRADKMSRDCFYCKMDSQCNWNAEKKRLSKELRL